MGSAALEQYIRASPVCKQRKSFSIREIMF